MRRIMALLLALAVLAERAAGRSPLVRLLVLWCARRAETAVATYVLEATGAPPPAVMSPGTGGSGPGDALVLAARLRVLAAALAVLLPVMEPGRRSARRAVVAGCAAPAHGHPLGGWTIAPHDTS